MVFLAMDGYVYMHHFKNGGFGLLGSAYYGKLAIPSDSATLMLVAEDNWYTFYVNDKKVLKREVSSLASGDLAPTLMSGMNKDFGTRCQMKNIGLWVLP